MLSRPRWEAGLSLIEVIAGVERSLWKQHGPAQFLCECNMCSLFHLHEAFSLHVHLIWKYTMQLLESKVCIWETTVHIMAQLDVFLIPRQLSKTNEQSCCCNWTRFIPCCLIFTAAWSAYKGQDSLLFFLPHSPKSQLSISKVTESFGGKNTEICQEFVLAPLVFFFFNIYLGTKSFSLSSMGTVCVLSDTEGFLEMLDVNWVYCVPLSVCLEILDISNVCNSGGWKLNGNNKTKQTQANSRTHSERWKIKHGGTLFWNLMVKMGTTLTTLRRNLESCSIRIFLGNVWEHFSLI